jgi:hypothetical protein
MTQKQEMVNPPLDLVPLTSTTITASMRLMRLHKLACWLGSHVWYETFRYAPQGFASSVYKVTERCSSCHRVRQKEIPYEANPFKFAHHT